MRNPKDTAVSMYHHLKQSATDQFTWDNFLKGYTSEGYFSCSHQFDYLRQMKQFEIAHPEHPIKHLHYEDLKQDAVPVIKDLSEFLGVQASDAFCQDVARACGFDNMKRADETRDMPDNLKLVSRTKLFLYRKGIVGDWKNTFTVAQSEMFDDFIANQSKNYFGFTFKGH
ncbi:sulfotransferase [Plakobranchus ocellatus]|uniref:Sulfotransferase n=1 Tax=Plakobranchus ocellatus TaxID=259542 RepID=A0AAV4CQF6_9GAST|nr:sulfotransferase [Plakobranchus ocellatus]